MIGRFAIDNVFDLAGMIQQSCMGVMEGGGLINKDQVMMVIDVPLIPPLGVL